MDMVYVDDRAMILSLAALVVLLAIAAGIAVGSLILGSSTLRTREIAKTPLSKSGLFVAAPDRRDHYNAP